MMEGGIWIYIVAESPSHLEHAAPHFYPSILTARTYLEEDTNFALVRAWGVRWEAKEFNK